MTQRWPAYLGFPDRRYMRRVCQLMCSLALFGVSAALQVRSGLGMPPWDVLHQGLARQTGLSLGAVIILVGAVVMLSWLPMRLRPGVGTVCNVVLVGLWVNAFLTLVPAQHAFLGRVAMVCTGILLSAIATAGYVGAGLGAGPRDGLMVGLVARTDGSVRQIRTAIEFGALALGWSLGGVVGLGTLLFVLLIGPLVHVLLPLLTIPADQGAS